MSVYDFKGYLFELHPCMGVLPLSRRTYAPRATVPRGFVKAYAKFSKLPITKKLKYLK